MCSQKAADKKGEGITHMTAEQLREQLERFGTDDEVQKAFMSGTNPALYIIFGELALIGRILIEILKKKEDEARVPETGPR